MQLEEFKLRVSNLKYWKDECSSIDERFVEFSQSVISFFESIDIEKDQIIQRDKDERDHKTYITTLADLELDIRKIYEFTFNNVLKHFEILKPEIIEEAIHLCEKLVYFNILTDENLLLEVFNLICDMLSHPKQISSPLCFNLIARICNDNPSAQKCLLNANLLVVFIEKFKNYFQIENITANNIHETTCAIQALRLISNKNENFIITLYNAGVDKLMIKYITSHYNNPDDILFDSCINLLQLIIIEEQIKSSMNDDQFFIMCLDILKNCNVEKNWNSYFQMLEILIMKFPNFGLNCVQKNIFSTFLEYILPFSKATVMDEKTTKIANILVLMTISVDSCKYLLDNNVDRRIVKIIPSCKTRFKASLCLLFGNFCINNDITMRLVNEDRLDEIIIEALHEIFEINEYQDDLAISYLSILKNLAIPIPNRMVIFSRPHFIEVIEKLSVIQHYAVLQKLFVFLKVLASRSDSIIAQTLVKSSNLWNVTIKFSQTGDSGFLCRPSALVLLLILIIKAKSIMSNFDFIDDSIIKQICNNVNRSFLSSFFVERNANEVFFSILSDDQVRMLEKYGYFDEIYSLATSSPFHPLLIYNMIHPLRRFVKLGLQGSNSDDNYFNDTFFSALACLNNAPELIQKDNLQEIINEFEKYRTQ